jgi:hypothetical protein
MLDLSLLRNQQWFGERAYKEQVISWGRITGAFTIISGCKLLQYHELAIHKSYEDLAAGIASLELPFHLNNPIDSILNETLAISIKS